MGRFALAGAIAIACCAGSPGAAAPDKSGNIVILGAGADSCGTWTYNHQGMATTLSIGEEEWVMGYVTGFNAWSSGTNDASGTVDNLGLTAWVSNYCAAHPLDTVAAASGSLIVTLYVHAKPNH